MIKRIRVVVVILVLAALATWLATRNGDSGNGTFVASGTVEATDADLGFQAPGRIRTVAVREGDEVEEGVELARLDTREVEAAVSAARAQVAAAEARLTELRRGSRPQEVATAEAAVRSARERRDDAQREAERAQTLYDGGAISRQAYDRAVTALEVAQSSLDQATEQRALVGEGPRAETIQAQSAVVEQARANLARAEAVLDHSVILAPFAGLITIRHREPGETVGAGQPVLTLLDPGDRWVRIYVPEDRIGAIRIGMAASVVSDTYPDRNFDGEVIYIGSEAEFTPRNVQTPEERIKLVYPVKVRITGDPEFVLKPGIPTDVTLADGA